MSKSQKLSQMVLTLVVFLSFYVTPFFIFPLYKALFFVLMPEIILSQFFYWFTIISHINPGCLKGVNGFGKIEAADRKEPLIEFAVHQVLEGHDFKQTSWIWTALSNGLNNHIIHHLFPQVAPCHYIALLPIVKQTCKEFNVQYNESDSFWQLCAQHFRMLYRLNVLINE